MFRRVITVKGWMISKVMGEQICGLKASRIRPRQSHEVSSGKVDSPHVERVWKKAWHFWGNGPRRAWRLAVGILRSLGNFCIIIIENRLHLAAASVWGQISSAYSCTRTSVSRAATGACRRSHALAGYRWGHLDSLWWPIVVPRLYLSLDAQYQKRCGCLGRLHSPCLIT